MAKKILLLGNGEPEPRPTILFFTNSELGQASVCLAVAHEFLIQKHRVHVASFNSLYSDISTLNKRASAFSPTASTARFHVIDSRPMKEAVQRKHKLDIFDIHESGFWGALKAYNTKLTSMSIPWDGDEYLKGYKSCLDIIEEVLPDVIVVDPLLNQAKDACNFLGLKFIILSPNTFKEHVLQPGLANFWKYPQICTGWPYPLPWYLVLLNIYLTIRLAIAFILAPEYKGLESYRNAFGIPGLMPNPLTETARRIPLLLQTHPSSDFPSIVPSHVVHCGPILRPSLPINEEDPELATWLARRSTVLINMGSLVAFDNATKYQFALAIRTLLDTRPDIQILWKLQLDTQTDLVDSLNCISREISNGRVRIEKWLSVEPISILLSGHVKCVVHHGGSNSYHEAIRAGIPQIILPVWFDTYAFAARVEWLGIGIYGNRRTAPAVNSQELGHALVRVVGGGEEAEEMKRKAGAIRLEMGEVEGRVVAYESILRFGRIV